MLLQRAVCARHPLNLLNFTGPLCELDDLASCVCSVLRNLVPQAAMVGLFCDLRGIATATNSRRTYSLMFDWLYPQHFPAILKCLEVGRWISLSLPWLLCLVQG